MGDLQERGDCADPRGDDISYIPFDPTAPATMMLGALEFRPHPLLRLTPNVVYIPYQREDDGHEPPNDLQLRMTFFLDLQ
ncbi:MAG: hypothetical protein PVJ49_07995 [Acidobacteriota bacterium]